MLLPVVNRMFFSLIKLLFHFVTPASSFTIIGIIILINIRKTAFVITYYNLVFVETTKVANKLVF